MSEQPVHWLQGFPTSIRVGLYDLKIEVLEDVRDRDGDACRAIYRPSLQDILFMQDQAPQRALETVLHELGHVIWDSMNIASGDTEERLVTAFALGWAQLWRDNPRLVKWLAAITYAADMADSGPRLTVISGGK